MLWVGMGGHRLMLMIMVRVWVQNSKGNVGLCYVVITFYKYIRVLCGTNHPTMSYGRGLVFHFLF